MVEGICELAFTRMVKDVLLVFLHLHNSDISAKFTQVILRSQVKVTNNTINQEITVKLRQI